MILPNASTKKIPVVSEQSQSPSGKKNTHKKTASDGVQGLWLQQTDREITHISKVYFRHQNPCLNECLTDRLIPYKSYNQTKTLGRLHKNLKKAGVLQAEPYNFQLRAPKKIKHIPDVDALFKQLPEPNINQIDNIRSWRIKKLKPNIQ